LKLFIYIVGRGTLPIYILSEIVDNLTSIAHSAMALFKWRQFIYKLKRIKDVTSSTEEGATPLECSICLCEIKKGKQLSCGHVFHLVCLRSWLIEKLECPSCRAPIQLDRQPSQNVNERRRRMRNAANERNRNRNDNRNRRQTEEYAGDEEGSD